MVELFQVIPDRFKGTGLSFGIQGRSYKGYFVSRYHIFDHKSGKVIIKDITNISEKKTKDIYKLELGSTCNSVGFISDIPNCDLICARKPKLNKEDIYYVPVGGGEVGVKHYINIETKRSFTRGNMNVCELYLPSSLFKNIKKLKDKIEYYSACKSIENMHQLSYKDFIFTVTSNFQEINMEGNAAFLKDLKNLYSKGDPTLTKEFKNNTLANMQAFIEKYQHFEVET